MHWVEENSTFHSSIPEAADLVLAAVYTVFGVCSLLGNGMLLYLSYKQRSSLKPAEFFIVNLALSDLGMTLSLCPPAVTSSIYHRWLYGEAVCVLYAFCGVLFGICSLSTLTALSAVCCLKVCYPLYGQRLSPARSRLLVGGCWAYALLFASAPLLRWGAYGPEPYGTACCIDWRRARREPWARSYTLALLALCYALPCGLMLLCYGRILRTLREARRAVEQHVVTAPARRAGNVQAAILKLSVAVCSGFLVAWSPYALVCTLATYGDFDRMPPMAFAVPAVFAKSSALYNPLIYLLLKPNYRHLLGQHLRAHRCPPLCCLRRLALRSSLGPFSGPAPCSDSSPRVQATLDHHFKHYPRCCHGNVIAGQGGREPRGPWPGAAGTPGAGPATFQDSSSDRGKTAPVAFCEEEKAQQEAGEVRLETVSK